jgi:TrmH family RNA methyltransferase
MTADDRAAIITSTGNQRIIAARKLRQRKYRQESARFLVEGLQILHMALDAGATPREAFYCPEQLVSPEATALIERFRGAGATLLRVAPRVMETLSERDEPQGIVATFSIPDVPLGSLKLPGQALILVLDRLQDPGNLGTLIRTADAVRAGAIFLVEPCVDPYDPKTVRGSMGSLFNLPVISTGDVPGLFAWLDERGFRAIGADPHLGELWGEGLWRGSAALVLGNEARGLSEDVTAQIRYWVRLPIVGRAESLNVAVAGGVLMYTWLRANLATLRTLHP